MDVGLAVRVMAGRPDGQFAAPTTWYTGSDLTEATSQAVLLDYDRNSRDDLVVAVEAPSGTIYRGLRSTGKAFSAATLSSSTIAFSRIKLATSDVDRNGRGDLVVYVKPTGSGSGTRLYVHRSTGTALASGELWLDDATLDWQAIEPY